MTMDPFHQDNLRKRNSLGATDTTSEPPSGMVGDAPPGSVAHRDSRKSVVSEIAGDSDPLDNNGEIFREDELDGAQQIVLYKSNNLSFTMTVRGTIFLSLLFLVLGSMGTNIYALTATLSYTKDLSDAASYCLTPDSFTNQAEAEQLEKELLTSFQRKATALLSVTAGRLDLSGRRLTALQRGSSDAAESIYPGYRVNSTQGSSLGRAPSLNSVDLSSGLNTTILSLLLGTVISQVSEAPFVASFAAPSAQTDASAFISVARSSNCAASEAVNCVIVVLTSGVAGSTDTYFNYETELTASVDPTFISKHIEVFLVIDQHKAAFRYAAAVEARAGSASSESFVEYWNSGKEATLNTQQSITSSDGTATRYLSIFHKSPFDQTDLDLGNLYTISQMPSTAWSLTLDSVNSVNGYQYTADPTGTSSLGIGLKEHGLTSAPSSLIIENGLVFLVGKNFFNSSLNWNQTVESSIISSSEYNDPAALSLFSLTRNTLELDEIALIDRKVSDGIITANSLDAVLQWKNVTLGGFSHAPNVQEDTSVALLLVFSKASMYSVRETSLVEVKESLETVNNVSIAIFIVITVIVAVTIITVLYLTMSSTSKTSQVLNSLAENLTHVATMELEKATIFRHPPKKDKPKEDNHDKTVGADSHHRSFDASGRRRSRLSILRTGSGNEGAAGENFVLDRGSRKGTFQTNEWSGFFSQNDDDPNAQPPPESTFYSGVMEVAAVQEACNKMIHGLKEYRKYLPATLFVNSELPPLEDLADELINLDDNSQGDGEDDASTEERAEGISPTDEVNHETVVEKFVMSDHPDEEGDGITPKGSREKESFEMQEKAGSSKNTSPSASPGQQPTRPPLMKQGSPDSSNITGRSPESHSLKNSMKGSPKHGNHRSLPGSPKAAGSARDERSEMGLDGSSTILDLDEDSEHMGNTGRSKLSALEFGLRRRRVTVLAVSFAGFLKLSQDAMSEAHSLSQMFLQLVLQVIEKRGGVVLHLTADRVVATWNAFKQENHHEAKGAQCAIDINRTLQAADDEFLISDVQWVIAVTSGVVLAGNSGTLTERASVAQGSCIELATELLALMLGIGLRVVCTQRVKEHLPSRLWTIPVDAITEADESVTRLYELHTGEEPAHIPELRSGFTHLEQSNFDEAIAIFQKCFRSTEDPHALRLLKISLLFSELNTPYIRTMPAWQTFESDQADTSLAGAPGFGSGTQILDSPSNVPARVRYKSEKRKSAMADEHLRMELMKLQMTRTTSASGLLTADNVGSGSNLLAAGASGSRTPRGGAGPGGGFGSGNPSMKNQQGSSGTNNPPATVSTNSQGSANGKEKDAGALKGHLSNVPMVTSVNSPTGPGSLGSPQQSPLSNRPRLAHSGSANPTVGGGGSSFNETPAAAPGGLELSIPVPQASVKTSPPISANSSLAPGSTTVSPTNGGGQGLMVPPALERKTSTKRRFPSFLVSMPGAPDEHGGQQGGGMQRFSSFQVTKVPGAGTPTAGGQSSPKHLAILTPPTSATNSMVPKPSETSPLEGEKLGSGKQSASSTPKNSFQPESPSPSNNSGSNQSPKEAAEGLKSSPSSAAIVLPAPPRPPTPPPVVEFTDRKNMVFRMSENVLGRGAFGEVVLGMTESGGLVAIKAVPIPKQEKQKEMSAIERRRLKRKGVVVHNNVQETIEEVLKEVAVLSKLRHENIVGYLSSAIINDGKKLVVAMEYISGGSLHSLLKEFKAVPMQTARRYLRDILRGLQFLHEQDIVHRDIKPHNVLLLIDGSCKVTDFGTSVNMSKLAGASEGLQGTPQYMAPEAARNKEVGKPSDIWSFGIMLAQLITGELPWADGEGGFNPIRFLYQLANNDDFVPVISSALSTDAREVVEKCCQRDQTARPTCAELLQLPFFSAFVAPTPMKKKHRGSTSSNNPMRMSMSRSRAVASGSPALAPNASPFRRIRDGQSMSLSTSQQGKLASWGPMQTGDGSGNLSPDQAAGVEKTLQALGKTGGPGSGSGRVPDLLTESDSLLMDLNQTRVPGQSNTVTTTSTGGTVTNDLNESSNSVSSPPNLSTQDTMAPPTFVASLGTHGPGSPDAPPRVVASSGTTPEKVPEYGSFLQSGANSILSPKDGAASPLGAMPDMEALPSLVISMHHDDDE